MTTCSNCHRVIGDLETPYSWNGYTVCINCSAAINAQQAHETTAQQQQAEPIAYADPLDQLAAQAGAPAYRPSSAWRPGNARRPVKHPLVKSGGILMLISLPLLCLFWPAGILLLLVGLVLYVVGSCQ